MRKTLSQEEIRTQINNRLRGVISSAPAYQSDLISQAAASYARKWNKPMPSEKVAILVNSLNHMEDILSKRGVTRQQISSAVSDLSKVDNPITLLFSLMSIIIPNFAYSEAIGIQPMPTNKSPIYFPVIEANEDRNGVSKGEKLLGSSNWNTLNSYTTNRGYVGDASASASGTAVAYQAAEGNIKAGTFIASLYKSGTGTAFIKDDGKGVIPEVTGYTTGDGSVNYETGEISFTLAASLGSDDALSFSYRYEMAEGTRPAQIVLKWEDLPIEAEPYRLRSTYDLDNFYQAKQVLSGYDIDQVMNTSLAGYINKEISGNVFDDILASADADYSWSATPDTGVAWALHRLQLVQVVIKAANGIRQNIARAGGNVIIAGTDWMNEIETLGSDLWTPQSYAAEPIGPYVAGTLAGKFKVIKNQDYPTSKAVMVYKANETEASFVGGSFISLYSTPPLATDDLNVIQGMGTRFGYRKAFDNSVVTLTLT